MHKQLVLLPGWGLGCAPLRPLLASLQTELPEWQISTQPLPAELLPEEWLPYLEAVLPAQAVLAGWSLGGALASAVALARGTACPGLITFASNPCFVARVDWPSAMPSAEFGHFRDYCAADSVAALKNFALLCSHGADHPRRLAKELVALCEPTTKEVLLTGLAVLASLDVRAVYQAFSGKQRHYLAKADALVPQSVAKGPAAHFFYTLPYTSHAFVLNEAPALAKLVQSFLQEAVHD